ncbi:MAG: UDP-N-acetylmuramate dehydrogenase [Galactobacillus timonensis]|nr:UDP-N-acetylmuramate dehydrogenase [Galactobacillus timonensis]
MKELEKILSQIATVEVDKPLAELTTLHIGGPADYVIYPDNMVALDAMIRILRHAGVPFKIFGNGSNLLCSDEPFHGAVIRLKKFNNFSFVHNCVLAEAGCSIIALSYKAMEKGLSGLEFASGIPGTVGGAAFMNAGAYRSDMSHVLDAVFVYRDGRFEWIPASECGFAYRTSLFQSHPDWVIIAVRMVLQSEDPTEIHELMDSRRERRMASQPLNMPSAGSVFRNPDSLQAWKLVDGIGYRGHRCGDAQVSEKHSNFIVNAGNATADDFLQLVEEIQQKVRDQYQIDLHMEVEKFNWK